MDDDSPGLSVFADFKLSLDNLCDRMDRAYRDEQVRLSMLPNYVTVERMSSPGAAVTDIVDFGGPQPGREWDVRLLSAFASPLAANTSQVTWYVGQIVPGPGAGMLPSTNGRWFFASVPAVQTFSSRVLMVKPGQKVFAGLVGVPANSFIGMSLSFNDQPAYSQRRSVAVE